MLPVHMVPGTTGRLKAMPLTRIGRSTAWHGICVQGRGCDDKDRLLWAWRRDWDAPPSFDAVAFGQRVALVSQAFLSRRGDTCAFSISQTPSQSPAAAMPGCGSGLQRAGLSPSAGTLGGVPGG